MSDFKIYISKGKSYKIPKDREKDFLSKRKDAVYNEELTNKAKDYEEYKNKHIGGFTTFKDGTSSFMPLKNVVPDIQIDKPELSLNPNIKKNNNLYAEDSPFAQSGKPLVDQISNIQRKEIERKANTPEHIFGRELKAYGSSTDYPKIEDYQQQELTDKDIPLLARKYLAENKQDTTEKIWIPTDRKHGEAGYWMEKPTKANTPEQIQQVKDFLTNTEVGQHYLNYEKELKSKLKNHIDTLESRIKDVETKQMLKYNGNPQAEAELQRLWAEYEPKFRNKFIKYNLNKEFETKQKAILDKYPSEKGNSNYSLYGDNSPLWVAKREIESSKKLMKAIDDGDLNYISQFGKEFGRGFRDMADDIRTFGTNSLWNSLEAKIVIDDINDKLKNGKPLSEADKVAMDALAATQAYNEIDGNKLTVSQEVAQGLLHSIPFMVDFATIGVPAKWVTKGATTALKSGIKRTAIEGVRSGTKAATERLGLRLANFGVDTTDALARSSIIATVAPSTYADAINRMVGQTTYDYENGLPTYTGQAEQKDTFDAITGAIGSAMIENVSEFSGFGMERGTAMLKSMMKKNAPELAKSLSFGSTRNQFFQGVNKAMTKAGFNGTINEFLEEQVATVLHSFFNTGQAQWSDLVDPRQQWITFLTVASIGSGAAVLNTAGDKVYRYGINRSYQNCIKDFDKAFARNMSKDDILAFSDALDSGTIEDKINALENIVLNAEYNDIQKTAALNMYKSSLTYDAMQGAKQAETEEAETEAQEFTDSQVNPAMDAIVYAKITGVDNPVRIANGNIERKEDGSIDVDKSDKEIYYFDESTGKNKIVSIDHLEELTEATPREQAQQQVSEIVNNDIAANQQNAEVREYNKGDKVRAVLPNGMTVFAEINNVLESGNYFVTDDTMAIKNEILDILQFTTSRTQALEELEENRGISENDYYQQQEEAESYQEELIRQNEKEFNEIENEINEQDLLPLINIAVENGATLEELDNLFSPNDIINYIEQLQDGRRQEQESHTGRSESKIETDNSQQPTESGTQITVEERDESGKEEDTARPDRSTGLEKYGSLTDEEKEVVDAVNTHHQQEIKSLKSELEKHKRELRTAKKNISTAQNEGQTDLFSEKPTNGLFDINADLSKRNIERILNPIKQKISFTENEIEKLKGERQTRIEDALQAYRSQTNIDFEKTPQDNGNVPYNSTIDNKPEFGSSNTFVTREEMEEAKRKFLDEMGGSLSSGFNWNAFPYAVKIASFYFEGGARKFTDFAKAMIDELGELARDFIKPTYEAIRAVKELQQYAGEMDAHDFVMDFDIENFGKEQEKTIDEKPINQLIVEVAEELFSYKSFRQNYYSKSGTVQSATLQAALETVIKNKINDNVPFFISLSKDKELYGGFKKRVANELNALRKTYDTNVDSDNIDFLHYIVEKIPNHKNFATYLDTTDQQNKDIALQNILNSVMEETIIEDLEANDSDFIKAYNDNYKNPIFFNDIKNILKQAENENKKQKPRDTETIELETTVIESTSTAIGNRAEDVADSEQAGQVIDKTKQQKKKIESLIKDIDMRLSDLNYSTEGVKHEIPINELSKDIKRDVSKYIKAIAELANLDFNTDSKGKREICYLNIPPAGGEVTFYLWSKVNPELGVYVHVPFEPEYTTYYDNYRVPDMRGSHFGTDVIKCSIVEKNERYRAKDIKFVNDDITAKEFAETIVKQLNNYYISNGLEGKEQIKESKVDKTKNDVQLSLFFDADNTDLNHLEQENKNSNEPRTNTTQNDTTGEISDNIRQNKVELDDRPRTGQGIRNDAGGNAETLPNGNSGESGKSGIPTNPRGQNAGSSGGNSLENGGTTVQSGRNDTGNTNRNNTNKQADGRDTRPSGFNGTVLNHRNFRIGDKNNIVPKGAIAKIKANIKAIETLKKIKGEQRDATEKEKHILSQYSGWGSVAEVLNKTRYNDENWLNRYGEYHDQIVKLLTEEEYNTAVGSTLNAHFTSGEVVSQMWELAEQLGFKGGNVLEPAIGTGNFFGLMPEHLSEKSALKAYELDMITGNIAKHLYPDARVSVTGYENSTDRNIDLIITNVPFAQTAPYDSANKDLSKFSLHNYFIAKGIRQLAPNGIGLFITSRSTMDSGASSSFREWVTREGSADFIGAIRLPNNAFADNAGTEVTTDILIFRKRDSQSASPYAKNFNYTATLKEAVTKEGDKTTIDVNEYYIDNPDMMLGNIELAYQSNKGTLYTANDVTLSPIKGQNLPDELRKAIKKLPVNISDIANAELNFNQEARNEDREGTMVLKDGWIYEVIDGELVRPDWVKDNTTNVNGKRVNKETVAKQYLQIKNTVAKLNEAERQDKENIEELRQKLNREYDSFNREYSYFNRNAKLRFLTDTDLEYHTVFALEVVDKKTTFDDNGRKQEDITISKADIFKQRIIYPVTEPTKADNITDALNISLSYRGILDLDYIAGLTGLPKDKIQDELIENDLAYLNPVSGLLEDNEEYLSGYVRTKYNLAVEAAKQHPEFERNVEALKQVVPDDIPASQIKFRLGSTFINTDQIDNFVKDVFKVTAKISYVPVLNKYVVDVDKETTGTVENTTSYGTKRRTAIKLLEYGLNQKEPIIFDYYREHGKTKAVKNEEDTSEAQAALSVIEDEFINYMYGNEKAMQEIERIYNEQYNDYVEKKYSVPVIEHYPNASQTIKLRKHQKKAVSRGVRNSLLLAHQVGTGKTFTLITIAMEKRRLGIAKKPMIVVQNSTLEQFVASFKKLYPSANILAPNKKMMDSQNRQRLFSLIAYGDYDAVIIPQSFVDKIPDDKERVKFYIKEQIEELQNVMDELDDQEDRSLKLELENQLDTLNTEIDKIDNPENYKKEKKGKGKSVKGTAKKAAGITKRILKQADRATDSVMTFEKMGIDALLVDEAHAYKRLGFFTKMSRIKGIDTSRSQRAFGMFMKTRFVQERSGGNNVIFSTGTPITNTMAETWTMMKFVSPDVLEKYNIESFDEFAGTFGSVEPSLEFTAAGTFKIVKRFKSYINAPELMTAFRVKTDVVLTEDIPEFKESNSIPKLKDGKYTQVIIKQSEGLMRVMDILKQTLEEWQELKPKEKRKLRHVPLVIFNRAKQAAIDLRLVDSSAPDDAGSKTNAVIKEVIRIYKESEKYGGTQLIFSDLFQSSDKKFNLYNEIRSKLIAEGIKPSEIAIIYDFKDNKREALFDDVNNGIIRIVKGGTEKLGIGVNVQERLAAVHHVDAPPRPMDFEQRNGRILRQGNMHAQMGLPVEVVTYGVEKTLDATAYQRLDFKQKFINQIMKGDNLAREISDEADEDNATDMSFMQMMAVLSGSQFAQMHYLKTAELKKLEQAERSYLRKQVEINKQIKKFENYADGYEIRIERFKKIDDEIKKYFPENKIETITIDNETYNEKLTIAIDDAFVRLKKEYWKNADKRPSLKIYANNHPTPIIIDLKPYVSGLFFDDFQEEKKDNYEYSFLLHGYDVGGRITSGMGLLSSFSAELKRPSRNIQELQEWKKESETDLPKLKEELKKPFEKAAKLDNVRKELADLEEKMKEENVAEKKDKPKVSTDLLDDFISNMRDLEEDENGNVKDSTSDIPTEIIEPKKEVKTANKENTSLLTFGENEFIQPIKEFKHTKTGEILYLGKMTREVERDEFNTIRNLAKSFDGWWSKIARGFLFNSKDDAQQFLEAANGESETEDETRFEKSNSNQNNHTEVTKNQLEKVIGQLKKNGLASDIVTDEKEFEEALRKVTHNNGSIQQLWFEMAGIKKLAIDNGNFMLAPNGKRTNLTEHQWLQVRSTAFKKWFGDWENKPEKASKVVDENGEPLVVYHGTLGNFNIFDKSSDIGFHFGTEEQAKQRVDGFGTFAKYNNGNKLIMPVFLNIKNAIQLPDYGTFRPYILFKDLISYKVTLPNISRDELYAIEEKISSIATELMKNSNLNWDNLDNRLRKEVNKFFKDKGFDGVKYDNSHEGIGFSFIAFSPNQIKSALSNVGTFDAANPDIRMEMAEGNIPTLSTPKGETYGFVTKDKTIYLNPNRMNVNTPIHEYAHLWNSIIKKNNPELYNKAAELIKNSSYWQQINRHPDYKNLSEAVRIDEALARAIGDRGELFVNRTQKQKFVDWLKEVWNTIKKMFGIHTNIPIQNLTLSEFTDFAVRQLLSGKQLGKAEASEITRFDNVNDLVDATDSDMAGELRDELDRKLKTKFFRIREAYQDRHLAVKHFFELLQKNGAKIEDHDNFYMQSTAISGKVDAQLQYYDTVYQKPLNRLIKQLKEIGFTYRDVENYAILKHGLERNEYMLVQAFKEEYGVEPQPDELELIKAEMQKDFSGITAVEAEIGKTAEEYIQEFEDKAGEELTKEFWDKVREATRFSLKMQYRSGIMAKETYDDLMNRFTYYIPLRGHDQTTAEDIWDYTPDMGTYFVAPLIKAKGRKTRSRTPFAYIFNMANSAISSSNKNLMHQMILRIARNDKTGLMTVSKTWYELVGMDENGRPMYEMKSPEYNENASIYQKNIHTFEEKMRELAEQGLAIQKTGKLNIGGLFIKPKQKAQHAIPVYQNGIEYVVYINANPAVAQALNGMNTKHLDKALRSVANGTRFLAANFTTRNPLFVIRNFMRDLLYSSSILPVKENAKYAALFEKNLFPAGKALQRHIRGKSNLNNKYDKYAIEYILNGGKTGYSHLMELQRVQKRIERDIRKGDSRNFFRYFFDGLQGLNEFAENISRLSVYITSRQQGRSIPRSIWDAKEVTVNFNRVGTGKLLGAEIRAFYLFVNAAVQALTNFVSVAVKNPKKATALIATYSITGMMMPLLTSLIGGDDGLEEYYMLTDWERQNNLCIYTGKGFIKIPLPQELRVFHGMGDNIMMAIRGKKDIAGVILDSTLNMTDLIPANPLGSMQGSWADITPDIMKPFTQLAANRWFTGSRITNEYANQNVAGYQRVRTNKRGESYIPSFIVALWKGLDNLTGGDGVKAGWINHARLGKIDLANPDVINHMMRGYFGGIYNSIVQTIELASKGVESISTGEFKFKWRDTPASGFFTSSDDLSVSQSGLNSQYYDIANEVQESTRLYKGYTEKARRGEISVGEYSDKINSLNLEKNRKIRQRINAVKKYERLLKDLQGDKQKETEKYITKLKQEVVAMYKE